MELYCIAYVLLKNRTYDPHMNEEIALIENQMRMWNSGDIAGYLAGLSDDVTYSSPLVAAGQENASQWLQGKEEVAAHLLGLHKQFPKLELVDVLVGAGFFTLLLRHQFGLMSMFIEPDDNKRARRIIFCHSQKTLAPSDQAA